MSEKTGKQWNVEYMNMPQQRINRFYASTNGGYSWKWKLTGYKEGEVIEIRDSYGLNEVFIGKAKQYQNMLAASGVTLLNKLDNLSTENRNIEALKQEEIKDKVVENKLANDEKEKTKIMKTFDTMMSDKNVSKEAKSKINGIIEKLMNCKP